MPFYKVKHHLILLLGVCHSALGIALITKSSLGTPPVSSVAYALTFVMPLSLGVTTFLMNMVFLLGEKVILGKRFPAFQWLQIPLSLLLGGLIDGFAWVIHALPAGNYGEKLCFLLSGTVVLALGVTMEAVTESLVLPGDGVVKFLSQRTGWKFGNVKLCFDLFLVVVAGAIGFLHAGKPESLGEGTVIAALLVGPITRLARPGIERLFRLRKEKTE